MADSKVTVGLQQVEKLGQQYREGLEISLRRTTERGEQLLRHFVPKVTHNLEQGVSSDVIVRANLLQGNLIVAARSGRTGARQGTLHLLNGKTKTVKLSAQPKHEYSQDVDEGTGIYGPAGTEITPKKAKVLLVPMKNASLNGKPEAYVEINGEKYVFRRSTKGMKGRHYSQAAANQLQQEVPQIVDTAFKEL